MAKYRVTYTAAKRENVYRPQLVNGQPTGTVELLNTRVSFHEERSVEVEAADEPAAIALATKHLPEGVELSAHAAQLRPNTASGAATIPTPMSPMSIPTPVPVDLRGPEYPLETADELAENEADDRAEEEADAVRDTKLRSIRKK
jgi:hypothetical protein